MAIQRWRDSLLSSKVFRDDFEELEKEMKGMLAATAQVPSVTANMGGKQVPPPPPAQGLASAGNHAAKYEYLRRLGFEFGVAEGYALPFEFIDVVLSRPTGRVVVFALNPAGFPSYFEEEAIGFPSKELISKLQLIRT